MPRVYYPKCTAQVDVILYDYGNTGQRSEFHLIVAPVHCTVNINAYNLADTFSMTLRFEDLPFDPRLIRAIRATIYMLDLKSLRDLRAKDLKDNKDNIIFTGFADTHTINLSESERIVSFDGRDYTSFFIDSVFDNANLEDDQGKRTRKINLNRTVKAIIEDLISNIPGAEKIAVDDRTEGQALRNFKASVPNFNLVSGRPTSDGQYNYVQQNQTYWDVIVSLCEASALICYIELDKLVLTTPRILYQKEKVQSKQSAQFIFGYNIMSLEFFRNLGRKKKFNLLLRSFNLRTGQAVEVSIPRDATSGWAAAVNIDRSVQKIKELNAQGVPLEKNAPAFTFLFKDKTRNELVALGEKIFMEITRQQLEGALTTHEMTVTDDKGVEFDITKLKIGSALQIEIAQNDITHILRKGPGGEKISDSARVAYLVRRGYEPKTASDLIKAVALGTGKLRPTFYLREIQLEMGESGFSARAGFVNYIQLGELLGGRLRSG